MAETVESIDELECQLVALNYSVNPTATIEQHKRLQERVAEITRKLQRLRLLQGATGMRAGRVWIGAALGDPPDFEPAPDDESGVDDNPFRRHARDMGQSTDGY